MNPFIDIQIDVAGEIATVQYKVDPGFPGQAPFAFTLYAYQDEMFNEPLYSISGTAFYLIDNTKVRQNQLPSLLYKLSLKTSDNKIYFSNFFGWHPSDHVNRHKYLLASEIIRRERVRFNYAGLYAYLLKRKTYSTLTAADTDPITGAPLVDNTSTYGTGAAGGYYAPVLTRLSIEEKQTKTDYAQEGRGSQFTEMLSVRSVGFPFIDQHDIIALGDGKRFIVTDASSVYFPGTTMILLQTPALRLIPNTDTVYNIEVPAFPSNEQ